MSPTRFRNIEVDTDLPVDRWPAEAIETVLDRGSLSDWRRLKNAIRANPWGRVARTIEAIADWGEHYGVDAMMQRTIADARRSVDAAARRRYAGEIRQWRSATGLSLRAFAALAGTSASRLSDYENARVSPTTDVLGRIEHVARLHART